jgi:PhnB protein
MDFRPYVFFGGNCRDAFTRYQQIFGGELVLLSMADAPSDTPVPAEQADLIIHAALTNDGAILMGSDDPTGGFAGVQGIMVTSSVADAAEARRVFDALADGGEVTQPLVETFFSPSFGMCTDRFGTAWMVVADAPETP